MPAQREGKELPSSAIVARLGITNAHTDPWPATRAGTFPSSVPRLEIAGHLIHGRWSRPPEVTRDRLPGPRPPGLPAQPSPWAGRAYSPLPGPSLPEVFRRACGGGFGRFFSRAVGITP